MQTRGGEAYDDCSLIPQQVVEDFAKNANLPRMGAERFLEKGINYKVEVLCHDCRVSNSIKPPQPV